MFEGLAAGLVLPLRVYNTSIRYLDMDGNVVEIQNPFVHHKNETLVGVGDPWLYARGSRALAGITFGARLGLTIPLGRTVEDPFVLGDMGIPHEHSQFGTGTFGAVGGIEAARDFGPVRVDLAALTIQTFYANSHGYQAGDRYAGIAGVASSFGTKSWRFRATTEAIHETAERWSGIIHTDDGNIGRTDVLVGLEATYRITEDWHIGVQAKLPAYTHVVGGQLDPLGFIGISVGTQLQVFGEEHHHDDDDEHGHHHDHDDHDHDHGAPPDWTGLDMVEVVKDGSVVPLEPVPGKITVFDFWATWCEPCKIVDRELSEIAREHPNDIAVRKVNVVDTDSPANTTYLGAATLPHLKVYGRDGKLLWERSAPPLELASAVEAAITPKAKAAIDPAAPRVAIEAGDAGFTPARVEIERGTPFTLVFTRTSESTCGTDVHFTLPDGTKIDEELPLGKPVQIPITVEKPGEIRYSCGMDMNHGTIVVK